MSLPPEDLKRAARQFASGVTVVTVIHGDGAHGMTASSFASVSLDPPLILVSLKKGSKTRAFLTETGRFAVNILRADQVELARTFARTGDKSFDEIPLTETDGFAFLADATAGLGCVTTSVAPGGDHDVFIAEVVLTRVEGGRPLVYHDQGYRALAPGEL